MKELKAQIKNREFSSVYLFTGQETYLLEVYLNHYIDAIFDGQDRTMNMDQFTVDTKNTDQIQTSLETLPFMAEKRVVILKDMELFDKKKALGNEIKETLSQVEDTTICFIIDQKIDKRSKLYKYVQKKGIFHEFSYMKESDLINYIARTLKKQNMQISSRTASHFIHSVGYDLGTINIELSKLIDYLGDKPIVEPADIDDVCIKHLESRIFDLVDATGNKNRKLAMKLLHDMKMLREPETRILFMISRQINLLYQVKLKEQVRANKQELASLLKVPPFVVEKLRRQASNFTLEALRKSIKELVALEYEFKSGKIDLNTGLELVMIKMSGHQD